MLNLVYDIVIQYTLEPGSILLQKYFSYMYYSGGAEKKRKYHPFQLLIF